MDEITNNISTTDNFTWDNTTTSSAGITTWFVDFNFTSWEPYLYEKYTPKWHIMKGYKTQIKYMWNNKAKFKKIKNT